MSTEFSILSCSGIQCLHVENKASNLIDVKVLCDEEQEEKAPREGKVNIVFSIICK